MNFPRLPAETSPFLWGVTTGAVALSIIGFGWGGWVSAGTAERMAVARADSATVSALTPICVSQFQAAPKAKASLVQLREAKTWEQADYVKAGGWATMPGAKGEASRELAAACAEALTNTAQ